MADSNRAVYEARLGRTLGGKWKLERLIGIGGMAAVYAASHRNGAEAAIKILHAQYARRADARTRFLREGYIANKVGKGAVCVMDDDVDDDGSPYLVMDLLHGEPVDVRAKRMGGKLPLPEILWVASQVLGILETAHAHGIVHRDLKPDNLFWTTQHALTVLDFGVARLRDPSITETTRTGTVVGTPAFMAPEQALGSTGEIDGRTDLWSLGAIMFRLITGQSVHSEKMTNPLVTAATKRAPPIASVDPSVPPAVAKIVDTALQFEREKRYPNARAMRAALAEVLGPEPTRKGRFSVLRVSGTMAAVVPPPAAAAPAPPPVAAPAPPAAAPPADDQDRGLATGMSDDDSVALHELLRLMEVALLARAERGPADPKAIRTMDVAYRQATRALASAHIGLFWNVLPEGFVARGQIVWMAKPPLPNAPEQMHAQGVRMLGLLPGVAKGEFEEVVRAIGGDLTPFSDYATFLHSSQLAHVVHRIDPAKPGMPERERVSLPPPSGGSVESILDAVRGCEDGALRVTLLSRLERWGEGHEADIGAALETAGVELSLGLLRVLGVIDSPAAREAIEKATASPHALVRIVALAHSEAAGARERLHAELETSLAGPDPAARLDSLVSLEQYKVVAAGPALAQRIRAPSFDALPVEERRHALSAFGTLSPSRAEALAIELLRAATQPPAGDDASTRELAAALLGSIGESPAAREALDAAAASPAPGDERVRAAALRAIGSFKARAKVTGR